jgi:tetratricopeptide (TPR) repeat protein
MQERSVEALERVLAIDSNHPVALSTLAKAYEEEGDWSKATDMLQRALEYSETGIVKAEALTRLGLIYMDQLNDDAKAKQAFESAINEAPTAQALDALVMFARDEENDSRVGELLEMKLPIVEGRERLSVYRELASYYQRSGRDQDQLVLLEQAYQEAPEATKLTEMLVERYLKDQRFAEVEPMIRTMMDNLEAAGKGKALNRYTYQLGKLKQAQGEQEVAFELFERCRASDPTFAPALVALSQIYVNAERWDEAQALLSSLLI